MTIVNGYTTLTLLKAALSITDSSSDSMLEAIATSVSRTIDDYCGRRFWSTSETRYYTAVDPYRLLIDDLLSLTSVSTDRDGDRTYETSWDIAGANRDVDLEPANNALLGLPYWELRTTPLGLQSWPIRVQQGVEIAGTFGYAASTPAVIGQACLYQCQMDWQTQLASGQSQGGGGEFGRAAVGGGLHPFVRRMVDPYRRREAA